MKDRFCGWYFKCQSDTQTLAVIPASHGGSRSVQIITDEGSWYCTEGLEGNRFSRKGFSLNVSAPDVSAAGEVSFGELLPVKYDIMGPFRYVPFMQCRHSIVSMRHKVNGDICVNGRRYVFENASGYIEGDRGRSFPKGYAWTQSFFEDGSLMLSAADIPMAGLHFTGVIGVIMWRGREYRLATYLGAKAVKAVDGELVIRQGSYTVSARLIEKRALPLRAPVEGDMARTIYESAACSAAYRFERGGEKLLEFETDRASFEFEF